MASSDPDWLRGVPANLQASTFEGFDLTKNPRMKPALERCIAVAEGRAPGAFLGGNTGLGKTHLAAAAMRRFGPWRSIMWTVVDWLDMVRDLAFDRGMGLRCVLDAYLTQDFLLVFDEFGREKHSEWTDSTLFRVLNARTANDLPTIVTTNVPAGEVDTALRSRFREGAIGCVGTDVRGRL